MYVVTFYSFKGGVGRTQALVNVGCSLAAAGRRVLMVDFDLEAPGLDTYPTLQGEHASAGVLDYVAEYIATGSAPDVRKFSYAVDRSLTPAGALWIMPAGRRDERYASRLSRIDWHDLYENRDGYLMFEDLKAQWKDAFRPDYVLVDSRTGHTDVSGICTRQLPNAVVVLFFPNDQNLLGLQKVVSEIRQQPRPSGAPPIDLHFVTSNVPDLDDEDRILAERMRRFRSTLEFRRLAATVHHYDSLALLNQSIFTIERPRSRLSGEYNELVKAITAGNPRDREGALTFVKEIERRPESPDGGSASETVRLSAIRDLHREDPDVLFAIGRAHEARGALQQALEAYGEALEKGGTSAKLHLRHARAMRLLGEDEHSLRLVASAWKALESSDASSADVAYAIRILRRAGASDLQLIADSDALRRLSDDEKLELVSSELLYPELKAVATAVVDELLLRPLSTGDKARDYSSALALALISIHRFPAALEVLALDRSKVSDRTTVDLFNGAVAEWALNGAPPRDLLFEVLRRDREVDAEERTANYEQCLALASAALGSVDDALYRVAAAERIAQATKARGSGETFSCWRYANVDLSEFVLDTEAIAAFARGQSVRPVILG